MEIKLNGKSVSLAGESLTLMELLALQGISADTAGIAVAVNWAVVPRSHWEEQRISEGDEVEVIVARQGG